MWNVLGGSIKNCGSFLKYVILVSKIVAASHVSVNYENIKGI